MQQDDNQFPIHGTMNKHLACWARGSGVEPRYPQFDFRDWEYLASKPQYD